MSERASQNELLSFSNKRARVQITGCRDSYARRSSEWKLTSHFAALALARRNELGNSYTLSLIISTNKRMIEIF